MSRATSSAGGCRSVSTIPRSAGSFAPQIFDDRAHWDDFIHAYGDALQETSTKYVPWYVVPADHNWSRNLAVAEILVAALERLDPRLPAPDPLIEKAPIV